MTNIPTVYSDAATKAAMQAAAAANGGDDYKCIVRIFLFGGADSHGFLIPTGTNPNAAIHAAARATVLEPDTPDHPIGSGNDTWRISAKMDSLATLYGMGNVAFMRHIGTLNRHITKAEWQANPKVAPDQIFSHNTQQDIWQAAEVPDVSRTTGIFGRMAQLMDPYFNGGDTGMFATGMTVRENYGFKPVSDVGSSGPSVLDSSITGTYNGVAPEVSQAAVKAAAGITRKDSPRNAMYQALQQVISDNYNAQVNLAATVVANATTDPIIDSIPVIGTTTNPLEAPLKQALRVIAARGTLGHRRQTITIGFSGWDHHSSLRTNHDKLAEFLDDAIVAAWSAVVALGASQGDNDLANKVVFQIESEFGRTLTVNGTGGVDHAWAGHGIVVGNPVNGGLYGPNPDMTIGGPQDVGQGRYIPNVSVEEFHAPLLRWFGVPEDLMHVVLPNIGAYSDPYQFDYMS